jgi:ABC-type polysaccharide/polyol phosphate transport system ATPase subunit
VSDAAEDPAVIRLDDISKRYRRRSRSGWRRRMESWSRDAPIDDAADLDDEDDEDDEDDDAEAEAPVDRDVWALRDISLTIAASTSLAVVGPNGAGKTTLLKVLTRVVPPTTGEAVLRGRVAPMLAIATTHLMADFTTRQNVLLLCDLFAIPREVGERRMDAVLAFAELEDKADVKVRRYATGFRHRLAFAVALELQPDILISDGVLAVGDKAFRLRCLERVQQARRDGMTLVLASHDLGLVRLMCDRALWLEDGRVRELGPCDAVVDAYERHAGGPLTPRARIPGSGDLAEPLPGPAQMLPTNVLAPGDAAPSERAEVSTDEPFVLVAEVVVGAPGTIRLTIVLHNERRERVRLVQPEPMLLERAGHHRVTVEVPAQTLRAGRWLGRTSAVFEADGEAHPVVHRGAPEILARASSRAASEHGPSQAGLRRLAWELHATDPLG